MPKLNTTTGFAACGTAGGHVSFGNVTGSQQVLCDGGATAWLNPDEIAFIGPQSGSWIGTPGATVPQKVNIHTGIRTQLDSREASYLAVGGNRWQAGIAGNGGSFGSCGEFPGGTISRTATDFRGAASNDGTIALVDSYQTAHNGFRLSNPDGTITSVIANGWDAYDLTVIGANQALWPQTDHWGAYGITAPLWIPNSHRACWCPVANVIYLIHWIDGIGLVAREQNATRGTILATAEVEYHYDAIPWNGGIRIAWNTIDGEPPGSLVIVDWDLTSNVVDIVPPPVVVSVGQGIQAHPRKLWLAPYYSFSQRYGYSNKPDYLTYANAAVVIEEDGIPQAAATTLAAVYPMGLPLIVDANTTASLTSYQGSIIAWLASGSDFPGLQTAVEGALKRPECPIIAYLDNPDQWPSATPSWLTDRVWPSVQAYRKTSESVTDFTTRITNYLTTVTKYGSFVVLAARWDDVNGTQPISFTTDCMPVYAELVQNFPICGIMHFSDRRGNGLSENTTLKQWAQTFSLANVARPNRYDYWTLGDPSSSLKNKLGQTIELISLTSNEKSFLLSKLSLPN